MLHLKHVRHLYEMINASHTGWKIYIDSFLLGCKLNNLTENSINSYAERLGYFIRYCNLIGLKADNITKKDLQAYILVLIDTLSDATVNGRIQTLQRFYNYLSSESIWTKDNPMNGVKRIRAERKIKNVITPEDIENIIRHINKKTFPGYRNMTMLMLFFDTMIRRNELITLTVDNVNLQEGYIKVFGKGRKWREVAIGARMIKTLHFYLNKYKNNIPGNLVFCTSTGSALNKDNVRHIIFKLGKKAGLRIYPHLIRHSACTWFIRNGGSPAIAQRIMGHNSPIVTDRYTHLNRQDLIDAYKMNSPLSKVKI